MANALFLPSNEPAQQAMQAVTNTRAANALTQSRMLQNQAMQQDMQRRMELESVLRTSENPERAGYEWAKRNDQKLYTDLSKFYLERFVSKLRFDEKDAERELTNATGETIQMGNRYVALFKNEAGEVDPGLGVIDKFTGQLIKPHDAKEIAEIRADTQAEIAKSRIEMTEEIAKLRSETSGDLAYKQWRAENPTAPISEWLALKAKYQREGEQPRAEPGSYIPMTDKAGNVIGAWNAKSNEFKQAPAEGLRRGPQPYEERRAASNARSGLRAIATVRSMLTDKNILMQASIPGSLGARQFEAARNEMIDVITRLRTGAALNKDEESFYHSQAPTLLDLTDPKAIEYKLKQFEDLFNDLATGGVDAAGRGTGATAGGPYSDPAKEARYQEWKRRQGK